MYGWLPEVCDDASQVVTASRRLARLLSAEYNAQQLASGKRAWLTPVIVAWPDWLGRLLASVGPGLQPARLNAHQSRVLWESILREVIDDPLVSIPSLTRHAREAWRKLHEWHVPFEECVAAVSSRDQRVFADAASRYRERLAAQNWIDDAMLCDTVVAMVRAGDASVPERLVLAGFDRLTPEVDGLLGALRDRGTQIELAAGEARGSDVRVIECDDPDAELRTAGAWARAQLEEDPGRRIGIVVSGLEQDAARSGRLVREGLVPGWQYASPPRHAATNVSFGRRLHDYPAVEIALLLLRWSCGTISGRDLSLLLRSPFLGAGDIDARARFELELRRLPDRRWTPDLLRRAFSGRTSAADAEGLLDLVGELVGVRRAAGSESSPAHWAEIVDALLEKFRWPGDAALESDDFQLINRWRDLLNDLAKLELVIPQMTFGQAIGQLSAMASETIFQPELEGAVVQVLGPLEAAGLEFDRLWIAGLTASQWPPAGWPTALICRRLQRHYGLPDADPDDTAAYAQRVIERLLGSAASCVCSYPSRSGDSVETPTALLADLPVERTSADPGWHASQLCRLARSNPVADDPAPPVAAGESIAGGSATLQWQLTEPFSAFVKGRLGVSALWPIVPGLSPILRGNLVHSAAFHLYGERPSQADIRSWNGKALERRIRVAIDRAVTPYERHADRVLRELLALERERLAVLLPTLIAVDLDRGSFVVDAVEVSMDCTLNGISFGLRIDRIDRYDDGAVAILDYKTGTPRKFLDSSGEPADAQLIVYAIAVEKPVASLGFFNIDSRATSLDTCGRDAMDAEEWHGSLQRWTQTLERAAGEFAAGDVRIRFWQTLRDARPLNILSRFGELTRDA